MMTRRMKIHPLMFLRRLLLLLPINEVKEKDWTVYIAKNGICSFESFRVTVWRVALYAETLTSSGVLTSRRARVSTLYKHQA